MATKGVVIQQSRTKMIYTIEHYSALNEFLGTSWHIRISSVYGDFSYALLDTVRFHLYRPKPLHEFDVQIVDGQLSFTPVFMQQGY